MLYASGEQDHHAQLWYYKYFLGREHENYVCKGLPGFGAGGKEEDAVFFVTSVIRTPIELDNEISPQYRVIVWKKSVSIY